ncbi:hypothetical protein AB6A40_002445 [Gnathostoma spinigerum]|uniref:Nicotinamide-nucleotide adenylyltransferase n=1 Tax=Gnathostoma spinigerum TaxID=75299 RepID=A0ABD6E968_9BILA
MAKNDGRSTTCRVTNRKVALLACGSFNPPTFAHLRMFERAKDYLERIVGYSVVEGVISPIADTMECVDLLSAKHRIKMAKLAVQDSSWIRVDDWESEQGDTVQTVQVLQHLREVLAHKYDMDKEDVQPMLLCGGDVVESIAQMDKSEVDFSDTDSMANILRDFGLVVVARANTDPMKAIYSMDLLRQNQRNIHVIEDETFPNNLSASRLRTAVRRRESIHYCTDEKVVAYIESNNLYTAVPASSSFLQKSH